MYLLSLHIDKYRYVIRTGDFMTIEKTAEICRASMVCFNVSMGPSLSQKGQHPVQHLGGDAPDDPALILIKQHPVGSAPPGVRRPAGDLIKGEIRPGNRPQRPP